MMIKLLCLVLLLHGALATSSSPSGGTWSVKTLAERAAHDELLDCIFGIMTGDIPNSAMSASSNDVAYRGRLFIQREGLLGAGWSAEHNDKGQWIQVDLGKAELIAGVLTQGRGDHPQWVTSYEVACGTTESNMEFVKEHGVNKIFSGNTDMQSVVRNLFPTDIHCRYLRIYPIAWHDHISLRFDLLQAGCRTLHAYNLELICGMGMKSGAIPDSALSASSEFNAFLGPQRGRLDMTRMEDLRGAWSAKTNDGHQWIQVDLGAEKFIAGIITQGRSDFDQWVKSFTVSCGPTVEDLTPILQGDPLTSPAKVFLGNTNLQSKVINKFPKMMTCRYIRIHPVTWNDHISMRFEVIDGACYDMY